MILLKETAGDTLQGAIDGSNRIFVTSFDASPFTVQVFLNGLLKPPTWEDGFDVHPPRTIIMKEPPLFGDSLQVEYQSDVRTGGGAEGGCPGVPQVEVYKGDVQAAEAIPEEHTGEIVSSISISGQPDLLILATNLQPAILEATKED